MSDIGLRPAEEVMTLVADLEGEIVGFVDARLERSPDAMHRDLIYRQTRAP